MPGTILYNLKEQTSFRKSLRRSLPKGEVLLWMKLRNKLLGYKFRRQYGFGKYIVDFYCPKLRLAIEVDGLSHEGREKYARDRGRQQYLESLGVTILRFNTQEIFKQPDQVIDAIVGTCKDIECRELKPPHSLLSKEGT